MPHASAVEKSGGKFAFFPDGLSPSVIRCASAVEAERDAVLAALGLERYEEVTGLCEALIRGEVPPGVETFLTLDGPNGLRHRYETEDAACGMALLVSPAELCGIAVPVSRALLTLASCFIRDDFGRGRTLANMGLGGLERAERLKTLS